MAPRRASATLRLRSSSPTVKLAALLSLAGIILPSQLQISIAALKFTPGRIGVSLLFFPALFMLLSHGRRLLLCDLLVCATAGWIVVAAVNTAGLSILGSSAAGETLDFVGGYLIARAFFFGPAAVNTFIRVFKVFVIVSIAFAIADSIFGRLIVRDIIAPFVHANGPNLIYRGSFVRATSTFDHPILFGTFCSLAAAIFLYSEPGVLRRTLWVSLCFFGCILSMSSAPILSFAILLMAYTYDWLLLKYKWRWLGFWILLAAFICVIFVVRNNPVGWIISHLTLNPQTGWYRLMIWDAALPRIFQSPVTGYAFNLFNDQILDGSIDLFWLVFMLRYGVPAAVFLFFANIAACASTQKYKDKTDGYMYRMCTAFTMALVMFMFIGVTVHFWNYLLIFWALCIGVRASLGEWSAKGADLTRPARVLTHS